MGLNCLKPAYRTVPCSGVNQHKFVRYTGGNWRMVGVKSPLCTDICRKCGRKRGEVV